MKKIIAVLVLFPFVVFPQNNFKKKASVLFLGNSYTFVNNLPMLIYNIARANGDTMSYDGNLIGGYTFNNHFNDAASIAKIKAQAWDYVVLQAQSQEPSFPDAQVIDETLPYAIKLDSVVRENSNCTNVVFYETWGRKNGDQDNCASYPPLCTYSGMQARLRKWYKIFADTTDRVMAPVGEAFRASIAATPSLELYNADQSHPSLEGSYLAACVFYETLFQRSVLSNTYNPGTTATTLSYLQQIAHNILHDSLPVWNLGKNLPWADFTFTNTAGSYQFNSASPTLNTSWYFGDGTTSVQISPSHSYVATGTYSVSHVVRLGCKKDSVTQVINTGNISTGIATFSNEKALEVYPNPCKNLLYIKEAGIIKAENAVVEVKDPAGRTIIKTGFVNPLPVSQLANGVYFIKISTHLGSFNARFVKNE